MSFEPSNDRITSWLARGGITAALLFTVFLNFGPLDYIGTSRKGDVVIYSGSPLMSVVIGVIGCLCCLSGIIFWRQPSKIFRFYAVCLFSMAAAVFAFSPTGLTHRLIVTPTEFSQRLGAWFAPDEQSIQFDDLLYLQTHQVGLQGNRGPQLRLDCYRKPDGKVVSFQVSDMMKVALPEIYRQAERRGVIIGEDNE